MSRPLTFVTVLIFSAVALPASAQVGKSASQPYEESSAGRAMKRITFGAMDCPDQPGCAGDAFTTSGIFVNGTYANTRTNYGGNTSQADVGEFLAPVDPVAEPDVPECVYGERVHLHHRQLRRA